MAGKEIDLGPTGHTVRQNVERLRRARGLSYAELSRQLEAAGRAIPPLGLRRIEAGTRRVDVDDLVAIAHVLWVDPPTLLLPQTVQRSTRTTGGGEVPGHAALEWVMGHPRYWDLRREHDPTFDEKLERETFWNANRPKVDSAEALTHDLEVAMRELADTRSAIPSLTGERLSQARRLEEMQIRTVQLTRELMSALNIPAPPFEEFPDAP